MVWSAFDYASVPLAMLFATPVFISQLGLEQYGVLVLVTSLVGFNALFNFGFADTAVKYVSQHMSSDDRRHAAEIVSAVGLLALGSGLATGGLFALGVPLSVRALGLSSLPYATDTLYLVAALMPLRILESFYVAALRGSYRYDLAGAIAVSTKLINIGLQVSLALLGHDLPVLLLATLATVTVADLVLFSFASAKLGNIVPRFSRTALGEIGHYSVWSWVQGVGGFIYFNLDRILIAAFLGPTAIGLYGVCIQLAQTIHFGLAAVSHSLFPYISTVISRRTHDADARLTAVSAAYLTVGRAVSVTAVATGSLMAVFSYEILDLWVGADIADRADYILAILSIAFAWVASSSIVTYYTLNGMGFVRLQAVISLISAAVMGIATGLFIPVFGLAGAVAARFPDTVFRIAVRVYVGRSIIGGISDWVSFDFIRLTLLSLGAWYTFRELLQLLGPSNNVLKQPEDLVLIAMLWAGLIVLGFRMETWISSGGRPSIISRWLAK